MVTVSLISWFLTWFSSSLEQLGLVSVCSISETSSPSKTSHLHLIAQDPSFSMQIKGPQMYQVESQQFYSLIQPTNMMMMPVQPSKTKNLNSLMFKSFKRIAQRITEKENHYSCIIKRQEKNTNLQLLRHGKGLNLMVFSSL